jgi:steroid 5-alpha reductase family enzyme
MGREVKMASTRYVPPSLCWATYVAALACLAAVYVWPQHESPYWNAFLATTEATAVIFLFSFACSNTSLYDPAWCILPIALALGWMLTSDNSVALYSPRAWYALVALIVWYVRYHSFFPWDGWTAGIETEDWRYEAIVKFTGSGTALYWLGSLVSLHMTPTWLVFFALGPAQPAWTNACTVGDLGACDALAVAMLGGAIALQYVSDDQLRLFRREAYGPAANLNTSSSSKKICRQGLWKYSVRAR